MKKKYSKEQLIDLAINNINEDRKYANELLGDVSAYIGQQKDRYSNVGMVAAKYLETLQRSNEQLVKLIGLMKSADADKYGDLNSAEKENIYSELEDPETNGQ